MIPGTPLRSIDVENALTPLVIVEFVVLHNVTVSTLWINNGDGVIGCILIYDIVFWASRFTEQLANKTQFQESRPTNELKAGTSFTGHANKYHSILMCGVVILEATWHKQPNFNSS